MNVKVIATILILAVLTIVALVLVLALGPKVKSCSGKNQKIIQFKHSDKSLIFADLKPEEIEEVVTYLKSKLVKVSLVAISKAQPGDNCIYSIELIPPKKQDAILYLDKDGLMPQRQALVIVYFGSFQEPEIKEFVVGPLPNPSYGKDITNEKYKDKIPYHRRPVLGSEYIQIRTHVMKKEFPKAKLFFKDIFGFEENDSKYFSILTSAPRGFQSGDRSTWFGLFFNTNGSGYFLHPLGFEFLMNHKNLDTNTWKVEKVFYNGQYLNNFHELEDQYKNKQLKTVRMKKPDLKDDIASLNSPQKSVFDMPMQYEPQGARYSVKNNQVLFQHWSLAYGVNVNTGLRLYDIRFKGERVVYELGVQEAISIYGSNAPAGMSTRYMDGHFGIGRSAFQLVPGIDCPYFATYVDTHYLLDADSWVLNKGSVCIFELNSGMPLRRHFSSLGSNYYGGLANTVLVVRTVATLGNYDYVFDYVFYQNGAIESKVHATGYITSSFFMEGGEQHGHRVGPHTLGTIHNHFIQHKVDLDVGGVNNSVVGLDMEFQEIDAPWNHEHKLHQTKVTRKTLKTEDQSAFLQQQSMPRYIQIASKQKNKWNHERGYRIQMISFAGDYLPKESSIHNSMSWAKYKFAVTKYKEDEQLSSSIYNQNDPWTPSVKFSDFINNENIEDEDLVAWITTGFLHIPHSEDIPNTVTAGNAVGFFLRPYNYFNEDPSVHSEDAVYLSPDEDLSSCTINPLACVSETASCAPKPPPFTYNGFENKYIIL